MGVMFSCIEWSWYRVSILYREGILIGVPLGGNEWGLPGMGGMGVSGGD